MNGLNAQIRATPRDSWRSTPLISTLTSLYGAIGGGGNEPVPAGDYDFDLRSGGHGRVLLELLDHRGKVRTKSTNPIHAYWLPWASEDTTVLELDYQHRFFFTSPLGGCRIQISTDDPPKVWHIAGNNGQKWRNDQTNKLLREDQRGRRFSQSQDYGGMDNGAYGFVAGYVKNHTWQFVGQSYDVNPQDGEYRIIPIKGQNQGVIML